MINILGHVGYCLSDILCNFLKFVYPLLQTVQPDGTKLGKDVISAEEIKICANKVAIGKGY